MRFEPFQSKDEEPQEQGEDNIYKRIERSYHNISDIGAQRGHPPPTTVVMGMLVFKEWYEYCEENDLNYLKWEGKQIIIDKDAPLKLLGFSYHPDQEVMKKAKEAGL